ncbi:uncharacterized protein LOC132196784 [Neocloeon triangulifer]|uniref:uncharacterized protein LOC132196784 n=1 Tax=Neocloeon triangulifer TaxID=2078957 RepID=UPI00286F6584|nr:uncharacterized protein LOC132196784 [Neocloeon triangulifer]
MDTLMEVIISTLRDAFCAVVPIIQFIYCLKALWSLIRPKVVMIPRGFFPEDLDASLKKWEDFDIKILWLVAVINKKPEDQFNIPDQDREGLLSHIRDMIKQATQVKWVQIPQQTPGSVSFSGLSPATEQAILAGDWNTVSAMDLFAFLAQNGLVVPTTFDTEALITIAREVLRVGGIVAEEDRG